MYIDADWMLPAEFACSLVNMACLKVRLLVHWCRLELPAAIACTLVKMACWKAHLQVCNLRLHLGSCVVLSRPKVHCDQVAILRFAAEYSDICCS